MYLLQIKIRPHLVLLYHQRVLLGKFMYFGLVFNYLLLPLTLLLQNHQKARYWSYMFIQPSTSLFHQIHILIFISFRYWPSIAHAGSMYEVNSDLQGQECYSLCDIQPLGSILSTTTSTVISRYFDLHLFCDFTKFFTIC